MPLWVWIVLAIAAYWVVYNGIWYLMQALYPLEYNNLMARELSQHFAELQSRGGRGSQMIVTDEATGKSLRIRKDYRWGNPKINLDLIADEITKHKPEAHKLMEQMRRTGVTCAFGIKGTRHFRDTLVCRCGQDIDTASRVVEKVFFELYCLPQQSRFRVRVKGFISGYEKHVSGSTPFFVYLQAVGHFAKPYKQWQRPSGFFYWVGRLAGWLATQVRHRLFPRDPEDDLRL